MPSRWKEPTEWDRGESIGIKIPYTAYPKPNVRWILNGKELKHSKNINTILKDRHALILMENVDEELSGKLKVHMENEMGEDWVEIELKINDRPSPPINLEVKSASDGSALLAWDMPPDTGYISQYIIERCELPGDKWIRAGTHR